MSELITNLSWLFKIAYQDVELRARLYLTNQTPVLVYQMGKVGSLSIVKSLQNSGLFPVFHLHAMLPISSLQNRKLFDENSRQLPSIRLSKIRSERKGKFLYENVILKKRAIKVISLTREPIGRNISAFFQNFERETGKKCEDCYFNSQELTDIFLTYFSHSMPLNWFDNHLRNHIGIDIYEYTFPKDRGFLSIQKDNVDLLVLKVELPDSIKEKIIAEFLGLKEFKIINTNVGEDKNYRDMYKEFRQNLKLPISYVEEMCSSKYFNHFYTEEEIKKVYSRWT